jgi:hypothetical protein
VIVSSVPTFRTLADYCPRIRALLLDSPILPLQVHISHSPLLPSLHSPPNPFASSSPSRSYRHILPNLSTLPNTPLTRSRHAFHRPASPQYPHPCRLRTIHRSSNDPIYVDTAAGSNGGIEHNSIRSSGSLQAAIDIIPETQTGSHRIQGRQLRSAYATISECWKCSRDGDEVGHSHQPQMSTLSDPVFATRHLSRHQRHRKSGLCSFASFQPWRQEGRILDAISIGPIVSFQGGLLQLRGQQSNRFPP